MGSNTWFDKSTFHYSQFADIKELVEEKEKKNIKISLCFPTLNEEKTIGKEIDILKPKLMKEFPLLDEIVVVDSGSTDGTRQECQKRGVDFYLDKDILPDLEPKYRGKGENLWKALYITKGDIILYLDSDIENMDLRFAYGLLGPLLLNNFKFSKAFYQRPINDKKTGTLLPTGGGRVTELTIKPLFSLFCPELSQFIQPLSGEYAGYREIFEQISFPIGYGIETSMLFDILEKWGLDIAAQVDLKRRDHNNQDIYALGKMAFGIMNTFLKRIEKKGLIDLKTELPDEMLQYMRIDDNKYEPKISPVGKEERPPIITIPEYCKKFGRSYSISG